MILTTDTLIELLQKQPSGTKILIEDFNGSQSQFLTDGDIYDHWERESETRDEQSENVMLISPYKESNN